MSDFKSISQFPFVWCRSTEPIGEEQEVTHFQLNEDFPIYRWVLRKRLDVPQGQLFIKSASGDYQIDFKTSWEGYRWEILQAQARMDPNRFVYDPLPGMKHQVRYYVDPENVNERRVQWNNARSADPIVFQATTQKIEHQTYLSFYFEDTNIDEADLDVLAGLSFLMLTVKS